jgi:hypothetical protein
MVVITDMIKNGDPRAKDCFLHAYKTLTSTLNREVKVKEKTDKDLKEIEEKIAEL